MENNKQKTLTGETTEKISVGNRIGKIFLKPVVYLPLLLLIAGFILLLVKNKQIHEVKEQANNEKLELINATRNLVHMKNITFMEMYTKPILWAIRAEMIRNNLEPLDYYLSEIVKKEKFDLVFLANAEGVILKSTDKKLEGSHLSNNFNVDYLSLEKVTVFSMDSILYIVGPVMGYESKLGTLVMVYKEPDEVSSIAPITSEIEGE